MVAQRLSVAVDGAFEGLEALTWRSWERAYMLWGRRRHGCQIVYTNLYLLSSLFFPTNCMIFEEEKLDSSFTQKNHFHFPLSSSQGGSKYKVSHVARNSHHKGSETGHLLSRYLTHRLVAMLLRHLSNRMTLRAIHMASHFLIDDCLAVLHSLHERNQTEETEKCM